MGCGCSSGNSGKISISSVCKDICTIEDAIAYAKRKLGAPVVCVEVANEQFVDIICDAIKLATRYLYGETVVRDYIPLKIISGKEKYVIKTKEDGTEDTQWYEDHPEAVWPEGKNGRYSEAEWCAITDTIDFSLISLLDGINILHSAENMLFFDSWVKRGNYPGLRGSDGALVGYDAAMTFLKEVRNQFNPMFTADFNELSHNLTITPTPKYNAIGLLKIWRKEDMKYILNHPLVKQLIEGMSRMQWGSNISKYNITMSGGGNVNGDTIFSRGSEMVEKAMDALKKEGDVPQFWVG